MFDERSRLLLIGGGLLLFGVGFAPVGCDRADGPSSTGEPSSAEGSEEETNSDGETSQQLAELADGLVDRIAALEKGKDVTSWTSFRLLDEFIAGQSFSDSGVLFKIKAAKGLVRAVWDEASREADGPRVTVEDIETHFEVGSVAGWSGDEQDLQKFATNLGLKNFHNYRNTSEHWRILLSILQDEIHAGESPLKPPTDRALELLAESATHLSLELLRRSSQAARREKSPRIEPRHLRSAFVQIRRQQGVENRPRPRAEDSEQVVEETLQPVTRRLIESKIESIDSHNEQDEPFAALDEATDLPLEREAYRRLRAKLTALVQRATAGRAVHRSDTFLGHFPAEPEGESPTRRSYLDEVWVKNTLFQVFPYVILPNGDVKLRFELSPAMSTDANRAVQTVPAGPGSSERPDAGGVVRIDLSEAEPFESRLVSHRLRAVSDSGIHWRIVREAFRQQPFAIDAFAAEYLSEMIAIAMTLYLKRAQSHARQRGAQAVGPADVRSLLKLDLYAMVLPGEASREPDWGAERRSQKQEYLSDYPDRLFARPDANAGFPTELPIDSRMPSGFNSRFNIADAMGAGIAVGDVDGDGYPDVFLPGFGLGRLYVNRGEESPGQFVDRTEAWEIPEKLTDAQSALFFDMEGDGDDDLLLLWADSSSLLLRNEGSSFVDVTDEVGLETHRGASVASVFDYDADGDLDIYIGYYGRDAYNRESTSHLNIPSESGRNGSPNQLYQRTEEGSYREVGARAGVDDVGWALAMQAFDYDNDGHTDLAVANDFGVNRLYRNRGDGTFVDVTERTRTGDRGSGMNISVSDVDGDGAWDFFLTNIDMFSSNVKNVFPTGDTLVDIDESIQHSFQYLTGNKLYLNREGDDGHRRFVAQERERFEPGDQGWAWNGNFFDYDNDGDEDLYVANGFIPDSYAAEQHNKMYLVEEGTFYEFDDSSPEAYAGNSRSVASLDADRDGDMELLVNDFRSAPVYLENVQQFDHRWLQVQLEAGGQNSRAVGARVTLETPAGRQMRVESCGRGYRSQDDIALHFGLGEAAEADVTVRWPGGESQVYEGLEAGRRHVLRPR